MRLPVAEYAPDQPTFQGGATAYVNNVIPITAQSYGPMASFSMVSTAISARCQGAASFRGPDGTIFNTSGSAIKLYKWDGTTISDVSRLAGGAYAVDPAEMWSFAQFGANVVAVDGSDAPQLWVIGTSSNYAALTGSPPVGRFVTVVKDFLVMGRIAAALNRIQWPDINSVTAWASGQADLQDFATGGRVMGVVGGEFGVVLLETAIYRMVYVGTPDIFQFGEISLEKGCAAEGSIAAYDDKIFFWNFDGFWMMIGGNAPIPIGDQKVDAQFLMDVNLAFLYRVTATVDPVRKLYFVCYPSKASTLGTPDKCMVFNWSIGRWASATFAIDFIFSAKANAGYNTDTIDTLLGNTDATGVSGDSSVFTGSPQGTLAGFSTDFKFGFFNGAALAYIIDSMEGELSPGNRTFVTNSRPEVDGGTPSVTIGYRDRLVDLVTWDTPSTMNTFGDCPTFNNHRYQRARMSGAAGDLWNHCTGIGFDGQIEGDR